MVYIVMIKAPRKRGITHEYFKARYEQHMLMVADLCGDAAPLSHTRFYPHHDSATDTPVLLAGNVDQIGDSVIVLMEFKDEGAFGRFTAALTTEDANAKIMEDEAGFWEREGMKVMTVDKLGS